MLAGTEPETQLDAHVQAWRMEDPAYRDAFRAWADVKNYEYETARTRQRELNPIVSRDQIAARTTQKD